MRKSSSGRLFMLRDGVSSIGHLTKFKVCAQELLEVKVMTDPFEWVFIPPIKVTARFFAPIKARGTPAV